MEVFNPQVLIPQEDVVVLRNNVWMHEPFRKPPESLPEHKIKIGILLTTEFKLVKTVRDAR